MSSGRWIALAALLFATSPASAQKPASGDTAAAGGWVSGCALADGRLVAIRVRADSAAGDSVLADGRTLALAFPADGAHEAAVLAWFAKNGLLVYRERLFERFAPVVTVLPSELVLHDEIDGWEVYVEPARGPNPYVLYFPVGRRCRFQPYVVTEPDAVPGRDRV